MNCRVSSPEANREVSELLSVQDFWREAGRHGLEMFVLDAPRIHDVEPSTMSQLWNHLDERAPFWRTLVELAACGGLPPPLSFSGPPQELTPGRGCQIPVHYPDRSMLLHSPLLSSTWSWPCDWPAGFSTSWHFHDGQVTTCRSLLHPQDLGMEVYHSLHCAS